MSFNVRMAKETVVGLYHGIPFNNTKKQTIDTYNLEIILSENGNLKRLHSV